MRRLFLLSVLLSAGCQSVIGPFAHRRPERVDDPRLPTYEQEARGRDRLPLPQDYQGNKDVLPPVQGYPGTYGRENGR
ncbi:MAG TPA: hypothetical protein VFA26_21410 [Gemmataceae bacterium]|nr:hypothetical protein [Gemmataceae bacterium]